MGRAGEGGYSSLVHVHQILGVTGDPPGASDPPRDWLSYKGLVILQWDGPRETDHYSVLLRQMASTTSDPPGAISLASFSLTLQYA